MIDPQKIKIIPFFQDFPEDLLPVISPLFTHQVLEADQSLLEEGQINLNLFFLMEGSVKILVNNQLITSTKARGQVFGEMSLVGHSTCMASVITLESSLFLILNLEKFLNYKGPDSDRILRYFYKALSENLVTKLIATNQIAAAYRNVFEDLQKK